MAKGIRMGHLDYRGFSALLVYLVGMKLFDNSLLYISRSSLNGAPIMVVLVTLVIGSAVWLALRFMQKNPGLNWLEAMQNVLPKPVIHIIGLFLYTASLLDTGINQRLEVDAVHTLFLTSTPDFVLICITSAGAFYAAYEGIEAISRVATMLFPYLIFALLIGFALLYSYFHWDFLFPLPGIPLGEMARQLLPDTSIYGEIAMILVLASMARSHAELKKGIFRGIFFSSGLLILILILCICVFDIQSMNKNPWPFQQALQTIYINRYIQHLDAFFVFIWIAAEYVRFAITFFVTCYLLATTLELHDYRPVLVLNLFLCIVVSVWPDSMSDANNFRVEILWNYAGPGVFALLILPSLYGIWKQSEKELANR
ncbi:endospore germination permease [Fodinisporobacter ferrooxydans]|uniref:Endospore germination permease n=1 Tax=Fodinisporobacter ferrooxydans TaxID=2901836 RepID=A0ABY4CJY5_9BACL|nr:endospore germination permease [Alicyclobacillaceae bacterium MYW30-H2]